LAIALTGDHIREARRRIGKTQAALAAEAGISASYLNLIEHNRRRVAGDTLTSITAALNLPAGALAQGSEPEVLADLRSAAAEHPVADADPGTAQSFAARFPEWATLVSTLARQARDQTRVITALSDRLTHDPLLAENVHAMLSHITAIRSTAGILSQVEDIPNLQKRRFLETLADESDRLSDTAGMLADYLGAATQPTGMIGTVEELLDRFLRRHAHSFDALDREAEGGYPASFYASRVQAIIDDLLGKDVPGPARTRIRSHLETYAEDARTLPLQTFASAAAKANYDPMVLADQFRCGLPTVFRRLAVLRRPWIDAPQFGLIVVNASGQPRHRHPRPDFILPRHGLACPLWPLFRAFTRPGVPLLDRIEHDTGQVFATFSIALPREVRGFGADPDLLSYMLIAQEDEIDHRPDTPPRPVGTSCRICTRKDCPARSEQALLA